MTIEISNQELHDLKNLTLFQAVSQEALIKNVSATFMQKKLAAAFYKKAKCLLDGFFTKVYSDNGFDLSELRKIE